MPRHSGAARISRPPLFKIIIFQAAILLVCATALAAWDAVTGYSVLLGGVVAIAPQAYHSWQAFRFSGARATANVVGALLRGSAGKFLLTGALFVAVFVLIKPLNAMAVLLAFVSMIVIHIVALAWMFTRHTTKTISGNE